MKGPSVDVSQCREFSHLKKRDIARHFKMKKKTARDFLRATIALGQEAGIRCVCCGVIFYNERRGKSHSSNDCRARQISRLFLGDAINIETHKRGIRRILAHALSPSSTESIEWLYQLRPICQACSSNLGVTEVNLLSHYRKTEMDLGFWVLNNTSWLARRLLYFKGRKHLIEHKHSIVCIAHNLNSARRKNKLTKTRLAELTGVSLEQVTAWGKGQLGKEIRELKKVSTLLDISLDELCFREV